MLRIALAAALLLGSAAVSAQSIERKAAICGRLPLYPVARFREGRAQGQADGRDRAQPDALGLAEYFAAKPWPATGAPPASKADADIAEAAINSVVCTSCHLAQFRGASTVPRLAGQERDYLVKTMMDFRNHTRANSPSMSDFMNSITPEQIKAIASYLAGLESSP
jgi:cytochrome c553